MPMEVKGLSEVLRKLRTMPEAFQARVIRGAVAAGAQVIRDEATARAPYYSGAVGKNHPPPGTLQAAIYQVRLTSECTPTHEKWMVSVRHGKKAVGGADAYYATWVEYGTVKMAAHPYMRPAFEARKLAAVDAMRDFVARKLPEAVRG